MINTLAWDEWCQRSSPKHTMPVTSFLTYSNPSHLFKQLQFWSWTECRETPKPTLLAAPWEGRGVWWVLFMFCLFVFKFFVALFSGFGFFLFCCVLWFVCAFVWFGGFLFVFVLWGVFFDGFVGCLNGIIPLLPVFVRYSGHGQMMVIWRKTSSRISVYQYCLCHSIIVKINYFFRNLS